MENNRKEVTKGGFRDKYFFLSNFFVSHFYIQNKLYRTVENFYQSMKTTDPFISDSIRLAGSPYIAKKMGNNKDLFVLRKDWEYIKDYIMELGLRTKFNSRIFLRDKLVETKGIILIEYNTWNDKYWGVDINTGEGQNKLGKLLMIIRNEYLI